MKLARGEFEIVAKFIKEISGISLEKNKTYLIESRLSDLAVQEKCKTFSDLFFKAKFNKVTAEQNNRRHLYKRNLFFQRQNSL